MNIPTEDFWRRLSFAFEHGSNEEARLLTLQLFPGASGSVLVLACVTRGDELRRKNDYYSAELYYRLAITLYDRIYVDAHGPGICAVKQLLRLLDAQTRTEEKWLVLDQTEDLVRRAILAVHHQLSLLDSSLSA